jgi:hypothetical protein
MFLFKFITQLNTLLLMVIVINNFYIFFLFLHSFATDNKNRNKAAVFSLIFKNAKYINNKNTQTQTQLI